MGAQQASGNPDETDSNSASGRFGIGEGFTQSLQNLIEQSRGSENKTNRENLNSMCRVCNVVLSSEAMADSHYQGKQHRKKAREGGGNSCDSKSGANKQFFCDICQVQTTS